MRIVHSQINKMILVNVVIILTIAVILSGCDYNKGKDTKDFNITSYSDLINELNDIYHRRIVKEGNDVKGKPVVILFSSANRRDIEMYEELISVYEFDSADAAKNEATTISKNGSNIGGKDIDWKGGKPHIYQREKLIVCYVGSNQDIEYYLFSMLGKSITG